MNSKVSTSSISLDRKWNPFDGSDMKRCCVNSRIASYKRTTYKKISRHTRTPEKPAQRWQRRRPVAFFFFFFKCWQTSNSSSLAQNRCRPSSPQLTTSWTVASFLLDGRRRELLSLSKKTKNKKLLATNCDARARALKKHTFTLPSSSVYLLVIFFRFSLSLAYSFLHRWPSLERKRQNAAGNI